jgi:hypothetical protein
MTRDGKILGMATIRNGAAVGQDHSFCKWQDNGEVFEVREFIEGRHILTADGYGNLKKRGAYGNGALFVKSSDVSFVKNTTEEWCMGVKP